MEMLKVPQASPPVPQVSTRTLCSIVVEGKLVSCAAEGGGEAGDFGGGLAAGGEGAEEGG